MASQNNTQNVSNKLFLRVYKKGKEQPIFETIIQNYMLTVYFLQAIALTSTATLRAVLQSLKHIRSVLNDNQVHLSRQNLKNDRKQWAKVASVVADIRTLHENIENIRKTTQQSVKVCRCICTCIYIYFSYISIGST